MQARRDPLIGPAAAFNHCPYKVLIKVQDDLKVIPKSLQPVATPDVEVRRWMPERLEVGVKDILMKNGCALHLEAPMWGQRFVTCFDRVDFLKKLNKRAKNWRCHVLRGCGAQGVEGMPNMVIVRWPAAEGP